MPTVSALRNFRCFSARRTRRIGAALALFSLAFGAACADGTAASPINAAPILGVAAPACVAVGEEALLDASATRDEDGRLSSLRFLFGDGTPELRTTDPRARHVYLGPGTYEAVVRAFDNAGAEGRASAFIRVYPRRTCTDADPCGPGERCDTGLCRPDARDGGLCAAPPPSTCPPGGRACGTVTQLCGPQEVCMGGCCTEIKPSP